MPLNRIPTAGIPDPTAPGLPPAGRDVRAPGLPGGAPAGLGTTSGGRAGPGGTRRTTATRAPWSPTDRKPITAESLGITAPPATAVPDVPPSRTDPELWGMLSVEERVFFRKPGEEPTLTYSRTATRKRPEPPKIIGGRLDVRA